MLSTCFAPAWIWITFPHLSPDISFELNSECSPHTVIAGFGSSWEPELRRGWCKRGRGLRCGTGSSHNGSSTSSYLGSGGGLYRAIMYSDAIPISTIGYVRQRRARDMCTKKKKIHYLQTPPTKGEKIEATIDSHFFGVKFTPCSTEYGLTYLTR